MPNAAHWLCFLEATLSELQKSGLAEKPDKKQGLWQITERGRNYLENPPKPTPTIPQRGIVTEIPQGGKVAEELPKPPEMPEETITVPSQADIFKSIGQRLGVGGKKREVELEPIVYYHHLHQRYLKEERTVHRAE